MTVALPERHPILLRGVVVALIAAFLMTATGAFQTGEAPFLKRLFYWTAAMITGGLWGHACSIVVGRFVDADERPWLAVTCLSIVITGPLSVLVWAVTGPFFGHAPYPLTALPYLLGPVAVITVVVTAVNVFLGTLATRRMLRPLARLAAQVTARGAQPPQTHAAPPDAPQAPRFLDRLPLKLRGAKIHAVQAEDHYLRIHTDRGSDLILMRLSDAVEELEGLEGAQTHRSWWVARDAVSRRYARALREASWW